jgi:hypothetical protein
MGLDIVAKSKIYINCEKFHELEKYLPENQKIVFHDKCNVDIENEDFYERLDENYSFGYGRMHNMIRGPAINLEYRKPEAGRDLLNLFYSKKLESKYKNLIDHEDNEGYYLPFEFINNPEGKTIWIDGTSFGSLPLLYNEMIDLQSLYGFENSQLNNKVFHIFFDNVKQAYENEWVLVFG